MYKTYLGYRQRLQLKDFTPSTQTKIALAILQDRDAVSDIEAGDIVAAIRKVNTIWASLPGAPYNQRTRGEGELIAYFVGAGGTLRDGGPRSVAIALAHPGQRPALQQVASADGCSPRLVGRTLETCVTTGAPQVQPQTELAYAPEQPLTPAALGGVKERGLLNDEARNKLMQAFNVAKKKREETIVGPVPPVTARMQPHKVTTFRPIAATGRATFEQFAAITPAFN
jgi:hypothetical protein